MDPESEFDKFADTFLVEIGNVVLYAQPKDALFMAVNIIGKLMRLSRCVVLCTANNAWTRYEYWDRQSIESSEKLNWPQKTSLLVAAAQSSISSMQFERDGSNSAIQEELQYIGAESVLGHPLFNEKLVGVMLLQQCNRKRIWTQKEVTWISQIAPIIGDGISQIRH